VNKELIEKSISQYPNLRESAKSLGFSYTTLRYWIKKHGIILNRKRGRKCISNGTKYENYRDKGVKRKLEYIKIFGGKCSCCGYNKNWSALEFHHIDPKIKEIKLDILSFCRNSKETIEKELENCKLVCSNCHREIHNPEKIYYSDL
jgi:hypothetical protein